MKIPLATSLEEEVIKELKIFCAVTSQKMNEVIEKAITNYLKENEK